MNSDLKVMKTGDGSNTLYLESLDETYHSKHGAVGESWHVYINAGLKYAYNEGLNTIRLLEFGFGTGLNAFLTLVALSKWRTPVELIFTTVEKYPVGDEILKLLDYKHQFPEYADYFNKIHTCDWESKVTIKPGFVIEKLQADFLTVQLPEITYDVVYFDAFAPRKQPELWQYPVLKKIFESMKPEAALVTYSAKTEVRNTLASIGFQVSKLPGPPGKREIIRAIK